MQIKIQFGPSRLFLHLPLYFSFPTVTISPTPQNAALLCAFECASFSLCCGGHSVCSLIVILQATILIACVWFNSNSSSVVTSFVFYSLLSWLSGTECWVLGKMVLREASLPSADVTAKWGYIILTNSVFSQKVLQEDGINGYCWGWFCSSYLWWVLLKSKGYLRFLSTGCVGEFNREFCCEVLCIRNHHENTVQHLHGCGIQLCGAQKPLRLYSHPEQEAYLVVSFRISCRIYFLPLRDMWDCWKNSEWLFTHKWFNVFLIAGSPVGMGIAHRFSFSWNQMGQVENGITGGLEC